MISFTNDDHKALSTSQVHSVESDLALQRVYSKLMDLHKLIYPQFRNHNIYLYPHQRQSNLINFRSAASPFDTETMTLAYFRSNTEAQLVERLMGRDFADLRDQVEPRFHPVIELRLSPEYFTVELILSPDAWWDQQNLFGKLSIRRHRTAFYALLCELCGEYRLGFWGGIHLSDMHLTNGQLASARTLDLWMDTFEVGRDWFRVGSWYAPDSLPHETATKEIFNHIKALYRLYQFALWTSNNNYQPQTVTNAMVMF